MHNSIQKPGKLFVISAPSGGGKTSLTESTLKRLHSADTSINIEKVITYTSRPQRFNEEADKDYHFITQDDFTKKIQAGFFLETTMYDGEYYGSPISIREDLKAGKSFILITDRPGARKILTLIKDPVLIWITPPSIEELEKRITARGTESEQHLAQRIALARQEIHDEMVIPLFKHKIINNDFDQATEELCALIQNELMGY